MKRFCDITITGCPTDDSVLNLSSEDPDPLIFTGIGFTDYHPYQPPPLDTNGQYIQQGCYNASTSKISQAAADSLAQQQGVLCQRGGNVLPGSTPAGIVGGVPGGPGSTSAGAGGGRGHSGSGGGGGGGGSGKKDQSGKPNEGGGGNSTIAKLNPFMCVNVAPIPTPTYKVTGSYMSEDWKFTGNPPAGLSLVKVSNNSAKLQGTPTTPGNYDFTITATLTSDAEVTTKTKDTIKILGITSPIQLPSGSVGTPYSYQLTADGGEKPYTFQPLSSLPAGLTMNSSGLISGTPTAFCCKCIVDAQVTDKNGKQCKSTLILDVPLDDISLSPNGMRCDEHQTWNLNDYIAVTPYPTWTGTPPGCMTLTSGGELSGSPSATGDNSFPATATFANGMKCDITVHLTVDDNPAIIYASDLSQIAWGGSAAGQVGPVASFTVQPGQSLNAYWSMCNCCTKNPAKTMNVHIVVTGIPQDNDCNTLFGLGEGSAIFGNQTKALTFTYDIILWPTPGYYPQCATRSFECYVPPNSPPNPPQITCYNAVDFKAVVSVTYS